MVVDSSIVVLEAIETARSRGEAEPAIAGAKQIAVPVVAGFLTTAVVFLPLIYLKGLARAFFGVQAFAIVTALAAALLFSLTVTPVLARDRRNLAGEGRNPGRQAYLRLLDRALARPALAVAAGIATAALSLLALGLLPKELVPDGAASGLVVRYRLAPDLTPEAARRLGLSVEARTKAALSSAHHASGAMLALQLPQERGFVSDDREETGRITLDFPDPESAERARADLVRALSRLPDVEVWVEPRTSAFVESIERAGDRLEVVASAATPERAEALAARVTGHLRQAGAPEPAARRDRPRPALLLAWDVARLAALGADRDRLEEQVRAGLGGQSAGRVRIAGVEPEVLVRAVEPADPRLIPLGMKGSVVPLGALATLDTALRSAVLERYDGRPAVRLAFDTPLNGEAVLSALPRAADEEAVPGGQALELRRAFSQLRLALALSLLLVFLTVAALYESLVTPLVVMTTVPVALGGALGLLAAAGQTLNIMSFLGLILLAGVVVNNAIILVHRIEDHRSAGEGLDAAIRLAGLERYRPILMTTLVTLTGMLPLAVLGGEGVELRRALALAVLGGTATSAFASLVLVPVLYRAAAKRART
jgi:HAE1 family hydrophobic/amphiphilic exporter-1